MGSQRGATETESKTLTNGSESQQPPLDFDFERERARTLGAKRAALASSKSLSSESEPAPEYSDIEEEDVTTVLKKANASANIRGSPGWKPPFIARSQSQASGMTDAATLAPPASSRTPTLPPPGTVPLTPSLMYAIDRIAVAQSEAYGSQNGLPMSFPQPKLNGMLAPTLPSTPSAASEGSGEQWDSFWRDVTAKAGAAAARR